VVKTADLRDRNDVALRRRFGPEEIRRKKTSDGTS
jgi:hypothetical protein